MAPRIHIGCSGFAAAQSEYFDQLDTVEINTSFYNLPLAETAERWKGDAPERFVYALKAWQIITHPAGSPTYRRLRGDWSAPARARFGHFQPSEEVAKAWIRTRKIAESLGAKLVLFQTPPSFTPEPAHLADMRKFFECMPRGRLALAWEPRGGEWTDEIVAGACRDLGLIRVQDPFFEQPRRQEGVLYLRLHGGRSGGRIIAQHRFMDEELEYLSKICAGRSAYVYFNNLSMWDDARRFRKFCTIRALGT